jgi:DNA-directed RNA polymerase specialized sigma24 family protein
MQPHPQDPNEYDGYDLFRRAIVERDADAWAESAARYRPLMTAWANHFSASATIGERSDDLVNLALVRAWAALSPDRFAAFPSLAAVLAYLRSCVSAAVIDCVRSQTAQERMVRKLEIGTVTTPEQAVLEKLERADLWRIVNGLTESAQEYTIVVESFIHALPPRRILERHPDLFSGVEAIYRTKRNLLERLQRSHELRGLYQDWY